MQAIVGISQDSMAKRIVQELVPGTVVNLGVGIGFHVFNFITADSGIMLHAENGLFGYGRWEGGSDDVGSGRWQGGPEDADATLFRRPVQMLPGAASVDHVTSFGLIRTGRIHTTVLGAFEVDEHGRIANWVPPGRKLGNIGGAMDLLRYCPRVIVAMRHVDKNGKSKVRRRCEAPLGGERIVDLVVTDLAVLKPTGRGSLELLEIAPGLTVEQVRDCTEATLEIPESVPFIAC
jgi:acetate CoA/acetoacetate CoA-transferase beta subunit